MLKKLFSWLIPHTCYTCKNYVKLDDGYSYCHLSMLHIGEWQEEKTKHCNNWE